MEKIKMYEAEHMARNGFYLMHIEWDLDLKKKYPDCTHFVVPADKQWRKNKTYAAVVIGNKHSNEKSIQEIEQEMPFTLFDKYECDIDLDPKPSDADLGFDETRKREFPSCDCDTGYTPKYIVWCGYPKSLGYEWYRYCSSCDRMASRPMSERDSDNVVRCDGENIIISKQTYMKLERAKILHDKLSKGV